MIFDEFFLLSRNPSKNNRQKSIKDTLFFLIFFVFLCFGFLTFALFFLCFALYICFLQSPLSRLQESSPLCSQRFLSLLSLLLCEMENAARKAPGEMAALCVPNLCRAVLRAPLRGTISQEWPSPFTFLPTRHGPFPTDPPLLFSLTRKIIATALRITRSYLRPVRL